MSDAAIARLQALVRIPTVSRRAPEPSDTPLLNMAVAGVGSGALVAALPAAAAAAAPAGRTGFATGMTNATKTVGGAIASSIFAIALASTGSLEGPAAGSAPLSGYLTVWSVCAVAALLAAASLLVVPRHALADQVTRVAP